MLSSFSVRTFCLDGLRPVPVTITVHPASTGFAVTGLPLSSSTERVKNRVRLLVQSALSMMGRTLSTYPMRLAVETERPELALNVIAYGMAIPVVVASFVRQETLFDGVVVGGTIRDATALFDRRRGMFPILRGLPSGTRVLVAGLPQETVHEVAHVGMAGGPTLDVFTCRNLSELVAQRFGKILPETWASGEGRELDPTDPEHLNDRPTFQILDAVDRVADTLDELRAQRTKITEEEAAEVMAIHSIAGTLPPDGVIRERPFRAPHHSASYYTLTAGDDFSVPGEVGLAHHGTLVLDGFDLYSEEKAALVANALRHGEVVSRTSWGTRTFPARPKNVIGIRSKPVRSSTWLDAFVSNHAG